MVGEGKGREGKGREGGGGGSKNSLNLTNDGLVNLRVGSANWKVISKQYARTIERHFTSSLSQVFETKPLQTITTMQLG